MVTCVPGSISTVRASSKPLEQLNFRSNGLKILFVSQVAHFERHPASSVFHSLEPKCALVHNSAAYWVRRRLPKPGTVWLHTPAATLTPVRKCSPGMISPTFVDRAAAVFICEGILTNNVCLPKRC